MTGRSAADLDMIGAEGLKAELVVKCGHAVDFTGRQVKVFADARNSLLGKIALLFLHFLQDGNECVPSGIRCLL